MIFVSCIKENERSTVHRNRILVFIVLMFIYFCDNIANRFSKLIIDILNPLVKPISIIFSMRDSDSL